ncbi:hypothetical protein K502DRAFT_51987 [Neoconidiobolus thromboides FSU 785]|nr:hypothetical protein K502DRAFT_51987 [Neoconidiobolus thromboides FSU 785]
MSRRFVDLDTKLNIIKLAEKGLSHKDIANHYDIGRSTVTNIVLNKSKVENIKEGVFNKLRKRVRATEYDDLENRVLQFCTEGAILMSNGILKLRDDIDGDIIINKTKELLKTLNNDGIVINNNWLAKFRRKYKLAFKIIKKRMDPKDNCISYGEYIIEPDVSKYPLNNYQHSSNLSNSYPNSDSFNDNPVLPIVTYPEFVGTNVTGSNIHQSSTEIHRRFNSHIYKDHMPNNFTYANSLGLVSNIDNSYSAASLLHPNYRSFPLVITSKPIHVLNVPYNYTNLSSPTLSFSNNSLDQFNNHIVPSNFTTNEVCNYYYINTSTTRI